MAATKKVVRVAAVGDVHCTKTSQGALSPLFAQVAEQADILLLCGDLTDYGLPEEAQVLAKELTAAKVPVVGVLGNHDFESDQPKEVYQILCDSGVTMLDGDACELQGIGFAGIKGFAGGFLMVNIGWGLAVFAGVIVSYASGAQLNPAVTLGLVANGASELLIELFGDAGKHVRAAVGVNTLPLNASVEVEFIFETR